ncbi:MAG: class I SAM-dependent methyltransferase [Spirochaetales bacterium]|nr:class I SAM-dependent methyltransferase [Spirochaetales bacterium]
MNKTANFWNKLSSRYDRQVINKYSEAYKMTIEKTRSYLKNTDSVLDYACGTGITTIELARIVKEIYAIDISQDMINIANNKVELNNISNVRFKVCDIMDDTINENSFDVVLAFNILYFLNNIDEVLERIFHIVKNGGLFISVTDCLGEKKSFLYSLQSLLGKIGIVPYIKKYKMKEIETVIKEAGFSIIETDNLYSNPPNYFVVGQKKES